MTKDSHIEEETRVEKLQKCECNFSVPDSVYGEVAYNKLDKKGIYYKKIFLTRTRLFCPVCKTEFETRYLVPPKQNKYIFKGETIALQNRGIPSNKMHKILSLARALSSQFKYSKYHHLKEFILRKKSLPPNFEIRIFRKEDHKSCISA